MNRDKVGILIAPFTEITSLKGRRSVGVPLDARTDSWSRVLRRCRQHQQPRTYQGTAALYFPVVKGELPHGLEYNFGAGVGLTSGSDHVVVKFNVELEKYIGAIFGPSSTKAWLW